MAKKLLIQTRSFYHKCVRVWHVMRKPTLKEFNQVAKISAIGIVVIGTIGFFVSTIMKSFLGF